MRSGLIRTIGDDILATPGNRFPKEPTAAQLKELKRQIKIATELSREIRARVITANQCAEIASPYQFIILKGVVLINPRIVQPSATAGDQQKIGIVLSSLSIPGFEAEALLPREITLEYQMFREDSLVFQTKDFFDMEAANLAVALKQILQGETYLTPCIKQMALPDLIRMSQLISQELITRDRQQSNPSGPYNVASCVFRLNESGAPLLNLEALNKAMLSCPTALLLGLQKYLTPYLKNYETSMKMKFMGATRRQDEMPQNNLFPASGC